MVLLACQPGAGGWDVAAAWAMDAYGPGGLVVQIAELHSYPPGREAAAEFSGYARLDADAWCVISHDDAGVTYDLGEHTPGSGWLADLADLNMRIRRDDGTWKDGSDVIQELGLWLAEHGVDDRAPADAENDPQEGRWLIPARPWPPQRITFTAWEPPDARRAALAAAEDAAVDDLMAARRPPLAHWDCPLPEDDLEMTPDALIGQAEPAEDDARAATARTARALEARLGTAGLPTSPDPPHGLPLMDRARYVAAYALRVQATLLAGLANPVFRGHPDGTVSIELSGTGSFIGRLANTGYAKSPTGFGWGYLGSGAAALAKSLLTAALGAQAACGACRGTGLISYGAEGDSPRPWRPGENPDAARGCPACDECGVRVPPAVYQAFKEQVVARWPDGEAFTITRDELWRWLRAQDADHGLAAIAGRFPL